MMTTTMNKAYDSFAAVYDQLMDDVDYDRWALYYRDLLLDGQDMKPSDLGRVVECACGTGNLTIPLQKRGYQMIGVDLSREMLWQAAQKTRKQGLAIPYVQQNMKSLNLHRPVDAVLATCDGVNYLLNEEELNSFLQAAYRAIRPGGALLFDVSTPYKLKHILCSGLMGEDRENLTAFEISFDFCNVALGIAVDVKKKTLETSVWGRSQTPGAERPAQEWVKFFLQTLFEHIGDDGSFGIPMYSFVNNTSDFTAVPTELPPEAGQSVEQ
jgi:ubiquinone/menaquinone biosynthesis C-methylase UbiE